MGGKDEDFSEFAGARWLTLVRAASALGCTASEAEDLAQTTLLRAYVSWAKVAKADQGQREVVALRYYVRLTEPEIATTLGIAPGTVKSRLSRALAALGNSPDLAEFGDPHESR